MAYAQPQSQVNIRALPTANTKICDSYFLFKWNSLNRIHTRYNNKYRVSTIRYQTENGVLEFGVYVALGFCFVSFFFYLLEGSCSFSTLVTPWTRRFDDRLLVWFEIGLHAASSVLDASTDETALRIYTHTHSLFLWGAVIQIHFLYI